MLCFLLIGSCRGSRTPVNQVVDSRITISSSPPFSTKEPERYQATRITTSSDSRTGSEFVTRTTRVFIARDGQKRREEYDEGRLLYLETLTGRFAISPEKKIFVRLDSGTTDFRPPSESDDSNLNSPQSLLSQTLATVSYEKIGPETLNGRATTKYRVTPAASPKENETNGVTFIWIDDQLGMPVRSETSSTNSDGVSKVIIEMLDIRQDVDPRLFQLPADCKEVDTAAFRGQLQSQRERERSSPEKR
jgi:outer membrane lipoprotein-sorting protein